MVMIERSALLHAAHAATGLDDLGPPGWSEGLEQLLESVEKRMRAYTADHPRGRFGRHEYALDRFGLTPDEVAKRFAPYCRRFLPDAGGARP